MSNSITIASDSQYNFCPICGEKTERNEFPVGRYKKNVEVVCPSHGVLVHK